MQAVRIHTFGGPEVMQVEEVPGSLFLTRPTLGHYTADRASLEKRAGDVLGWIAAGKLTLRMEHNFALRDAAQAHASLEGRQTTGKVLLIP
jgi:NADPH2:quinone reductase